MENNFSICTEDLLNTLTLIIRTQKKLNNERIYENDVYCLTDLLINLGVDIPFEDDMSYQEKINGDLDLVEKYKEYYRYVRFFGRTGKINDEDLNYSEIEFDNQEAVDLAYNFFSQYGTFFWKPLEQFKKGIHSNLEFINNGRSKSFFVECQEDCYILIQNLMNVCKFSHLVHELQHFIDNYNNSNFRKNRLIRETSSMFMEMLSCDFFDRINDSIEGSKRRKDIHYTVKCMADNIFYKTQFLYLAKDNMDKGIDYLVNELSSKLHIKKEGLDLFTDTSLDDDYTYQLAYLIAVELYYMYSSDPDKAIWVLENIITKGNDDNIISLLSNNNIRVCENVMKYEKKLAK